MPQTKIILFRADDGTVPFLDWFGAVPPKAQDKCRVRLERLQQLGHELRRPEAVSCEMAFMSFAQAFSA